MDRDYEAQQVGGPGLGGGAGGEYDESPRDTFANVTQGLSGHHRDAMMEYWQETINNIENDTHKFKIHQLPLARIKKVMKADEDVKMISAEAPILFAKGCDIFITELTMRAWIHAEENKRRTLQRSDIANALQRSDMFDFLIDVVPREEARRSSNHHGAGGAGGGPQAQTQAHTQDLGGPELQDQDGLVDGLAQQHPSQSQSIHGIPQGHTSHSHTHVQQHGDIPSQHHLSHGNAYGAGSAGASPSVGGPGEPGVGAGTGDGHSHSHAHVHSHQLAHGGTPHTHSLHQSHGIPHSHEQGVATGHGHNTPFGYEAHEAYVYGSTGPGPGSATSHGNDDLVMNDGQSTGAGSATSGLESPTMGGVGVPGNGANLEGAHGSNVYEPHMEQYSRYEY